MIVRTKERELKHLIVDVVEHFAGQTVNRIIEIIEAGLKGKGDYDVKQAVADSLMDGTLELDENLHLRVSQSPVAISKATQKQVNEDRKSLEQESRDISPSEPQSGVLAKLRHIKDGYIEMKGRQVRLDPYSHRPAPSDRSQDASIYFALQRHHLFLVSYNVSVVVQKVDKLERGGAFVGTRAVNLQQVPGDHATVHHDRILVVVLENVSQEPGRHFGHTDSGPAIEPQNIALGEQGRVALTPCHKLGM